jgi:hypothetical protein
MLMYVVGYVLQDQTKMAGNAIGTVLAAEAWAVSQVRHIYVIRLYTYADVC